MKSIIYLLVTLCFVSCKDNTIAVEPDILPGISVPDTQIPDVKDSFVDPDESVHILDAMPIQDAIIDAAPPPPPCLPLGARQPCNVPGLLGNCANGIEMCNTLGWSDCVPVMFSRIEICDGLDNDCDGELNESPRFELPDAGEPPSGVLFRSCYTGTLGSSKNGVCAPGISLCQELSRATDAGIEVYYGYGECENQVVPTMEQCDNLDNDCDNSVDEGVLNACSLCGDVPVEICDGEDNDCDDQIDELLLNDCGACGATPRELCDFVDNDCDGIIDEDFDDGDCVCDHPDYVPQPEVCNGADDDCDGFIDEGPLGGPLTKLCSTDALTGEVFLYDARADGPQYAGGNCRLGISFCELGNAEDGARQTGYYTCVQEIQPRIERCNEFDDDCDGIIDEDFEQGSVAVMMIVDVSGSMNEDELSAAFNATRDSVNRLFNNGVDGICYMLAVVGNDDEADPHLFNPGDNCVPGVEDPPVVPIEDMSNAVNTLRLNLLAGTVNQGGSSENTLDAIGRFLTDDLIDWDQDGVPDNILWSTNRPFAQIQGVQDSWEVDLSQHTHRIIFVLGDEPAQGDEWTAHDAARAMAHSGGMVFIIGNRGNRHSYQQLIDVGAVHTDELGGVGVNSEQRIADAIEEVIEEAACINSRQEEEAANLGKSQDFTILACYEPMHMPDNTTTPRYIRGLSHGYMRASYE